MNTQEGWITPNPKSTAEILAMSHNHKGRSFWIYGKSRQKAHKSSRKIYNQPLEKCAINMNK